MVADTHPDEIVLFDYVEGELPQAGRAEVETHLATCTACSELVQRVQAGKGALREAQFLHLPERRREGVFMNLPTRAPEPSRRRAMSPKQLLAVLTPLVAIAAVIAVLASSSGNGDSQAGATGGGEAAQAQAATTGAFDSGGQTAPEGALSFSGPAADVQRELQAKGFRATRQGDRVVVKGATKQQVRRALADRGPGDVRVVVEEG